MTLPGSLVEVIAAHFAAHPPAAGLVFTSTEGQPIRFTNFRRRIWRPGLEAAGLDPSVRFHDLRHSHAAMLIAAGEHPKVIQARLGHASIRTTLDTYGHLFDGLDEAAADRLDAVFLAASASDSCQIRSGAAVAIASE